MNKLAALIATLTLSGCFWVTTAPLVVLVGPSGGRGNPSAALQPLVAGLQQLAPR